MNWWWSVPKIFPGGTVVVLGNGPSMNEADVKKLKAANANVIAVNETYKLAPWAWMLYAADGKWWLRHREAERFAGLKVSVAEFDLPDCVLRLRNTGIDGFDPDPECVRTGNNSGYQAVHIAVHSGAARILLLGFDMKGGRWWEGKNGPIRYDWIQRFASLAKELRERVEVINCTASSAMQCFPFMSLDDALKGVHGGN